VIKTIVILLSLCWGFSSLAQDHCVPPNPGDSTSVIRDSTIIAGMVVYSNPDEPARFTGGNKAMLDYIRTTINYTPMDIHENDQKVFLRFIVLKDASIVNINVIRGAYDHPEFDAEAIRVVKNMPQWIPAKVKGQPVNSVFNLPVRFCH
jgi:periplasmic protein TonB